jgi:hypothetical protein
MLQALIKWPGSLSSLATWEDWEPLHQCFPRAAIWGQTSSYGGGDVTTLITNATEDLAGEAEAWRLGRNRVRRERRPNCNMIGVKWVN